MPAIKIADVKKDYTLLPEGKYEVYIDNFDEVESVGGVETSSIVFIVRKDVDTANGGRKIFSNIKSSDNFAWLVNGLSKAVGIPTNTEFDSLTDFLNEIKGKSLVIKVKHRKGIKDPSKVYVNATDFYPTTKGNFNPNKSTDDTSII